MGRPVIDWQQQLVEYLLAAGTVGKKQAEVLIRFKNHAKSAELTNELSAMQGVGKVQKIEVPPKSGIGRKTIMWRATSKLLEGWP